MITARGRWRNILLPGMVLSATLLAYCPRAFALNPALDVSQFAHTVWKTREGFTKGTIFAITQTYDGYIWLATEFGLMRFDGVRNVPWTPPAGQHLPSTKIWSLLAARDGTLWIGTSKGLASWKDGKLTQHAELAGLEVFGLVQDREGAIWAGGWAVPIGRLCTIRKTSVQCYGEDGSLTRGVAGSFEDSKGNLWVGTATGVWRWKPGPPQFFPLPGESNGVQGMNEADDGTLLIGTRSGIKRLADGKIEAWPLPGTVPDFQAHRLFRDHDGGLWIGTSDHGILRVHHGRTDVFTRADGLSGDDVSAFFEDREGNIWVSSREGLDRFREFAVPTYSVDQGLSNARVTSVLAGTDGSVWLGTYDGLNRWRHGEVTIYRGGFGRGPQGPPRTVQHDGVREVTGSGLPDQRMGSLFQDHRGRIWMSTLRGAGYLENDRYVAISGVPPGQMYSITGDAAGNVWIANQDLGVFHLLDDSVVDEIPWSRLGHKDASLALIADRSPGGVWIGFMQGGVVYFKDGQVRASYTAAAGLGEGRVNDFQYDREGTLWAATEGGLSRFKNGRVATLTTKNGLPCDAVHWAIEDDADSFWLYTTCGLVRIARSDVAAWAAAVDKNVPLKRMIPTTVFANAAGVRLRSNVGGHSPHVAKSSDGRLWFLPLDGVSIVDPRHLPLNTLPPPVHIEGVKVNGKDAPPGQGMELSSKTSDLEVDYTALSLTIPESVMFRYKLEGRDTEWREAGSRRQAYYNGLGPRKYRFRVMASNNDGVWNEAGAAWSFSIVPAYYQTFWFRGLAVLAGAALLWFLYRLRLGQMTAKVNLLYTERLAERTRIARDLHDTLLQSLAGVSLQLHGISKQAATAPEKTVAMIGHVREQVDSCFREARLKVWNLRTPELENQGLAATLREFVERIAPASTARCSFTSSGTERPCPPGVEEELLRIAQEATNNANRHARANEIRVALEYGAGSLALSIFDDGCGFDFEEGSRKAGHWGLKNMQERSAQIRGTCEITTAIGQGTRIQVRVPLPSWSWRDRLAKNGHSSSDSR